MTSCLAESAARAAANAGSGDTEPPADLKPLGIAMGLAASVCINLSQNIQATNNQDIKEVQRKEDDGKTLTKDDKAALARSRRVTRLCTAVFATSAIVNFAAFSFAPGSVLTPLESAQFVTNFLYQLFVANDVVIRQTYGKDGQPAKDSNGNVIMAGWQSLYLNSRGLRILLGVLFVIGGVVLPVLASESGPVEHDVEALKCFWSDTRWLIMFSSILGIGVTCGTMYRWFSADAEGTTWNAATQRNESRVDLFFYSMTAGSVGLFAIVNAKAIAELVNRITVDGDTSVFREWILRETVVFVIVGFVGWLKMLSDGPRQFPQATAIPALQGAYIVYGSVGSAIFFHEVDVMTDTGLVLYVAGMVCTVIGVVLMVPSSEDAGHRRASQSRFYPRDIWWLVLPGSMWTRYGTVRTVLKVKNKGEDLSTAYASLLALDLTK